MLLARVAMAIEYPSEQELAEQRLRTALAANYRSLRRSIRRLGVPEFEVDDVVQEAFLAFHRKASSIVPRAERQFLLQAAFRIVLGRQRGFVRRREELGDAFDHIAQVGPNPEEELGQQQALDILDGILEAMPMELRMVFNLCDIEQLSAREAAEILGIPHGTATSRLRRARELFEKLAARGRTAQGRPGVVENETRGPR